MKKLSWILVFVLVLPLTGEISSATNQRYQSRLVFIEDVNWTSQHKAQIGKAKRAGFNAYAFVVQGGRGARWVSPSGITADSTWTSGGDPIRDVVNEAHAAGMLAIPVFQVSLHVAGSGFHDEWLVSGSTIAFDLNVSAYRDFAVNEAIEVGQKYNVDGVFFDYIRTQGVSPTAGFQNQTVNTANVLDIVERVSSWYHEHNKIVMAYANQGNIGQGCDPVTWINARYTDVNFEGVYAPLAPNYTLDFTNYETHRASIDTKYKDRFLVLTNSYDQDSPPTRTIPMPAANFVANLSSALAYGQPGSGVGIYLLDYMDDSQIAAVRASGAPFEEDTAPTYGPQRRLK